MSHGYLPAHTPHIGRIQRLTLQTKRRVTIWVGRMTALDLANDIELQRMAFVVNFAKRNLKSLNHGKMQ